MTDALDPAALNRLQDLERSSGKHGLMQQIVDAFFADIPVKLQALSRGLEQNDMDSVSMAAHGLKGSCYYVGAGRLGELCAGVEAAADTGDLHHATTGVAALERQSQAFRKAVDEWMDKNSPT